MRPRTDASSRRRAVWLSMAVALAVVAAAPAAPAQGEPATPVTTPVEPINPSPAPVVPPVQPATPSAPGTSPPFGASAVVLVGGFNSSSPFSTPACATTDRGPTWGEATGPAAALSAAGLAVYTAPIANAGVPVAASCLGGEPTPDIPGDGSTVIDSNGALAGNEAALIAFLTFLHDSYGVTSVALVGHSDGGLWSRAAISGLRATGSPVTITSLTTVGTPHTGSFGADIAEDLDADGGSCDDLHGTEEAVCLLIYAAIETTLDELGRTVIEELSSSWLSQWNPTTTIGCSVTTLGGNHVGWDLGVATYYTANDGIVGQASALNQETSLPPLQPAPFTPVAPPGGLAQLYDVVHSESLTFLFPTTELNSAAVAAAIAAAVQSPPSGPCVTASGSMLRGGSVVRLATGPRPVSGAAAARKRHVTRVPLRFREATRNGTLSRARRGDAILLLGRASVRCGARELAAVPLLGSSDVQIALGTCSRRLRVDGRAVRVARSGAHVRLVRHGRTVRWRVAGGKLRRVRVQLRVDGRWRKVSGHRVTVPRKARRPALRLQGVDRAGRTVRAFTRIAVGG